MAFEVMYCRWCGQSGLRQFIEPHEPECSKNPGCEICEEREQLHEHHLSYYPEETIFVCSSCHGKIHNQSGFHDEFVPQRGRPDRYGSGDFHERHAKH